MISSGKMFLPKNLGKIIMVLEALNQNNANLEFNLNSYISSMAESDFNKKEDKKYDSSMGNLELIYAKDGDRNYDSELDTNGDSIISYTEYLRYCEQNAKMEAKNSDTKIVNYNKSKFMTVSFGHASNAYSRIALEAPDGKVEGKA